MCTASDATDRRSHGDAHADSDAPSLPGKSSVPDARLQTGCDRRGPEIDRARPGVRSATSATSGPLGRPLHIAPSRSLRVSYLMTGPDGEKSAGYWDVLAGECRKAAEAIDAQVLADGALA